MALFDCHKLQEAPAKLVIKLLSVSSFGKQCFKSDGTPVIVTIQTKSCSSSTPNEQGKQMQMMY